MSETTSRPDPAAFAALVTRHQAAVCAVAYAILRDRARSEEVAQEAFLVAWQRPPAEISAAWVCGIARNLARNAARRRTEVTMDREPPAAARDARDELISREDDARAAAALACLPEGYREAVVLFYRGEQSMHDVAAALGVSEATARQRVHRGRERLREALAPVEAALRSTRPGPAFTAACVAAWIAHGATPARASTATRLPVRWIAAPLIAAAIGAGVWTAAGAASPHRAAPRIAAPTAAGALAGGHDALDVSRRRFRPMRPAGTHAPLLDAATPRPSGWANYDGVGRTALIDMDLADLPFVAAVPLLARHLDVPILIEDDLPAATVTLRFEQTPALDVLDEALAQGGASRTEVPALRVVIGGTASAAALGGEPVTMSLRDAPLGAVVDRLAHQLDVPVSLARDLPLSEHHVTIELDAVPAGVALDRVLAAAGLGCESTTGFVVTADD